LETWRSGHAEGMLIPANLSLLASLAGTPYVPSLRGAILLLEETDEPPQRCDRMLTQLELSGMLDGIAGLIFGQFAACGPRTTDLPADTLDHVLRDHAERIAAPTLARFPHGHEADFHPLPVGVRARIESGPPGITLLEAAAARG